MIIADNRVKDIDLCKVKAGEVFKYNDRHYLLCINNIEDAKYTVDLVTGKLSRLQAKDDLLRVELLTNVELSIY